MSEAEESDQSVREIVREELQKQRVSMRRRSFLATLAGAAGVGAAGYHMVQPVQASNHSGQVGSTSNLARIWAETIRDSGDNVVLDVEGSSLNISDADITGETFVEGTLSSNVTGISSGTTQNIIDTEGEDNNNELDNNQEFTPSETARYRIYAFAEISPTSDQDRLNLRVETSGGSFETWIDKETASGTDVNFVRGSIVYELSSGTTYKVTASDADNNWNLKDGRLTISKAVVHP